MRICRISICHHSFIGIAYASGWYNIKETGGYTGLQYSRVSRVVKA